MADQQRRRGSYAKGVAKREEILQTALDVIAREGFRGASVKELADAVGLSQAGLLHYFGSKEELFTEILRKRDELDAASFRLQDAELEPVAFEDVRAGYVNIVRHNSDVPGVVQLFARLSVDAVDPQHPAHDFFVERGRQLRGVFGLAIARAQTDGRISSEVEPETVARILQAVADGLQVQWMLEPDLDMAATVDALLTLLMRKDTDQRTR
ncbi:TetR/AcrR family transcriptional regulator [Microbacterium kunmingense]|uniref:TetR/AcrR family transcriptional regulator n=1 Tax=Microbacterium TaxID=33882 RepID=UPI002004287D|nr:TetR/AcrR family transcriptional regulator [Microbacterium kunmingense]